MKKRHYAFLIVLLCLFSTQVYAGTTGPSNTTLVYGTTDKTITRAEWLHDLAVVFDMTVDSDNYPDNYFSDLDSSHKYYTDILLTVQFGVVDVEAGTPVDPEEAVTREYAVQTLNYCLGFQLDEGETYTFSDVTGNEIDKSAQIALNRKWVNLKSGKFDFQSEVTVDEVKAMLTDTKSVWKSEEVDENYDSTFDFAEDVIVVPQNTNVEIDEAGTVTIQNCPKTIKQGDKFAVYYNADLPSVYKAITVTTDGDATIITTTSLETDEAFDSIDAQGVCDVGNIILNDDDAVLEIDNPGLTTMTTKKLTGKISKSSEIPLGNNAKASVKVTMKNPQIEYNINTKKGDIYIQFAGDTTYTYKLTGKAEKKNNPFTTAIRWNWWFENYT